MAVTIAQLDQELDRWQQRIDLLSQALLKLHDHPTYQRLSAQPLDDPSNQRLLDQAQQIFEQFDQLVQVIDQARQHRANHGGGGLWSSHQKIAQAQQLFVSTSVPLVLSAVPQPPGARNLGLDLAAPEPISAIAHVTPAEAIAKLSTHYKKLWADLLHKQTELEQQTAQLQQLVSQAQQNIEQLETLYNSALSMQQEYNQKITSPGEPPPQLPPPKHLSELRQALETGQSNLKSSSHWEAIAHLKQWQQQQSDIRQGVESALVVYCDRLNLRKELRGRLNALQAKAQAKHKIENPILSRLAAQAEATLYRRPTPLQQAIDLVQQYEQQLNQ